MKPRPDTSADDILTVVNGPKLVFFFLVIGYLEISAAPFTILLCFVCDPPAA